jgi:adenylate kinase family enzyme
MGQNSLAHLFLWGACAMPTTFDLGSAKRVLVYGVCGSGKTTLASRLSEVTGIPWHSVDDLAWLPGWRTTTEEYQRGVIAPICESESWILDTAYGQWLDLAIDRAEVIVALDYPRWFSFLRLLRRTFSRVVDKKPICNGNVETLRNTFSRDSILLWHFRSFRRKRTRIRSWAAAVSGPPVIVIQSAWEAEMWLTKCALQRSSGLRASLLP